MWLGINGATGAIERSLGLWTSTTLRRGVTRSNTAMSIRLSIVGGRAVKGGGTWWNTSDESAVYLTAAPGPLFVCFMPAGFYLYVTLLAYPYQAAGVVPSVPHSHQESPLLRGVRSPDTVCTF